MDSAGAQSVGPHETPQSASSRFLVEIVAWVTGPWALVQITGMWWMAITAAVLLIGLAALFSTPGDKRTVLVPTPGPVRVAIEVALLVVAVVGAAIVITAWAWYAVLALGIAFVITNLPRWRWLMEGAPPVARSGAEADPE